MNEVNEALAAKIDAVKTILAEIETDWSPATLASSFGAEDMVLTDLICKFAPQIEIFTLDTGRLPAETYALMQQVKTGYEKDVRVYFPDTSAVEAFVTGN